MSSPCRSNDRYTNDSNDINLSNSDGMGSGCNDEATTTTDATVIKQEIEEDTSPTDDDDDTFLSCISNAAQDLIDAKDVKQLDLKYDYEIHTTTDSNLDLLVNKFEGDLLNAIGEKYGLTACEFGRRSSSSSVAGVGSTPVDVKDTVYTECMVAKDDLTDSSSNCTPFNGKMTAWVSNSLIRRRNLSSKPRHLSETDLYDAIEEYSNSYTNEDGVLAISYIGNRLDDTEVLIQTSILHNNTSNSRTLSNGGIAGIAVVSLLALLGMLALVAKKRREKKNAEKMEARNIVNNALFMIDDEIEEVKMVPVRDDASVATEDYTYDNTVGADSSFESGGSSNDESFVSEAGFEVKL